MSYHGFGTARRSCWGAGLSDVPAPPAHPGGQMDPALFEQLLLTVQESDGLMSVSPGEQASVVELLNTRLNGYQSDFYPSVIVTTLWPGRLYVPWVQKFVAMGYVLLFKMAFNSDGLDVVLTKSGIDVWEYAQPGGGYAIVVGVPDVMYSARLAAATAAGVEIEPPPSDEIEMPRFCPGSMVWSTPLYRCVDAEPAVQDAQPAVEPDVQGAQPAVEPARRPRILAQAAEATRPPHRRVAPRVDRAKLRSRPARSRKPVPRALKATRRPLRGVGDDAPATEDRLMSIVLVEAGGLAFLAPELRPHLIEGFGEYELTVAGDQNAETVHATFDPISGGAFPSSESWIDGYVARGYAVMLVVDELLSRQPPPVAHVLLSRSPAVVADKARVGGEFAILAIPAELEQQAQSKAGGGSTLVIVAGLAAAAGGLYWLMRKR